MNKFILHICTKVGVLCIIFGLKGAKLFNYSKNIAKFAPDLQQGV